MAPTSIAPAAIRQAARSIRSATSSAPEHLRKCTKRPLAPLATLTQNPHNNRPELRGPLPSNPNTHHFSVQYRGIATSARRMTAAVQVMQGDNQALLNAVSANLDMSRKVALSKLATEQGANCQYLYAKRDGEVVGFTALRKVQESAIYDVDLVYVVPECRGEGVAKEMMEAAARNYPIVTKSYYRGLASAL